MPFKDGTQIPEIDFHPLFKLNEEKLSEKEVKALSLVVILLLFLDVNGIFLY
jgi:hypothetical protein